MIADHGHDLESYYYNNKGGISCGICGQEIVPEWVYEQLKEENA